ncbi:MAG: ribbon-helix-helix protein, CopG family [Gammaproteobacteria bacterium]
MNFSLHLSDDLVHRLNALVQATGRSRNALIREAIEEWLKRQEHSRWSDEVLQFSGLPEAIPFEGSRAELLPPAEPFDALPT